MSKDTRQDRGRTPSRASSGSRSRSSGGNSSRGRGTGGIRSSGGTRSRSRPPLQDNYYYEEPPRSSYPSRNAHQDYQDISSSSGHNRSRREVYREVPQKKRHPVRNAMLGLLTLVLVLVVAVVLVMGNLLQGLTLKSVNKENLGIAAGTQSAGDVKNIALFGLDTRDSGNEGRADVVMVLTLDNKRGKIKMTSILRDSEVAIEGNGYDKITHSYAYGGPELAIHTLNQNFSLDITDYITVNFMEMASIVDAFGGTRVTISYDEAMEINKNMNELAVLPGYTITEGDYLYEEGDLLLNGNQAVAYARIRDLDSDDVRASRQQRVLSGLISQLKNLNKLEYPGLIQKVVPLCETSLHVDDALTLLPVAFGEMHVESLSIPSEEEAPEGAYTDEGSWVYRYDLQAATRHINQFIYESDSSYQQ